MKRDRSIVEDSTHHLVVAELGTILERGIDVKLKVHYFIIIIQMDFDGCM